MTQFLEIVLMYVFAQSLWDVSNNKKSKLALAFCGKKFDEIYVKHAKKFKIFAVLLFACVTIKLVLAVLTILF